MFEGVVESLELFKKDGVPREEALNCLEFDSDVYPDQQMLEEALELVYGSN